jgi:hypothetical protein
MASPRLYSRLEGGEGADKLEKRPAAGLLCEVEEGTAWRKGTRLARGTQRAATVIEGREKMVRLK